MFLNEAREGIYGASFKGDVQTLLNSVTLPKKAWEKETSSICCGAIRLPSHNGSVTTEEWRCGLPQTTDSRQEGFMTLRYLEIFLALARTPNMRTPRPNYSYRKRRSPARSGISKLNWGFRCSIAWAEASGSMTRGGCSKNGWPRCITSSRMCSRWWRVTNWRARSASAHPLRCPTSCCRKCCTISRCGTIRSKSNVSRGIRRISCAMWNTACLTSGSWKGTSTTSPWKSPPRQGILVIVTADKALAEAGPYPI